MAKKERNSGLGRGLDSLIPNIEEKEVEEGISLEDLLKKSEKEEEKIEEKQFEEEPVDEDKELVFTEEDFKTDDDILVEESDVEKYEEEIVEEEVEDEDETDEVKKESSTLLNDNNLVGVSFMKEPSISFLNCDFVFSNLDFSFSFSLRYFSIFS